MFKRMSLALVAGIAALPGFANEPQVVDVSVEKTGMVWAVHVTIKHPDSGWDHYADGWKVVDATGNVLGYRELMHPHVTEQPFTRSLTGVIIPDGTREIFIETSCTEAGWAGALVRVELSP